MDTDDDNNDDDDDDTIHPSRTTRHSKKPYGTSCSDPTQLHFYPSNWAEVLTTAKGFWRLFVSMVFGFPKRRLHKDELRECLTRAIAAIQEEGTNLEPGESSHYCHTNTLTCMAQAIIQSTRRKCLP